MRELKQSSLKSRDKIWEVGLASFCPLQTSKLLSPRDKGGLLIVTTNLSLFLAACDPVSRKSFMQPAIIQNLSIMCKIDEAKTLE